MRPALRTSRAWYFAETVGIAAMSWGAFRYAPYALERLGMPAPQRPWAEPDSWIPGVVPPFPWVDCAAYFLGLVAVPLLLEWAARRNEWRDMGLRLPRAGRGWAATGELAATIVALLAYQRLIVLLLGQRLPHLTTLANLYYFAGLWACVAIGEEFFLRGVLQRRLMRLWGSAAGIVIVAAFFAFGAHYLAPVAQNALLRLPVGLVLGWMFVRWRSLLPPVVAHFLLNLAAFV